MKKTHLHGWQSPRRWLAIFQQNALLLQHSVTSVTAYDFQTAFTLLARRYPDLDTLSAVTGMHPMTLRRHAQRARTTLRGRPAKARPLLLVHHRHVALAELLPRVFVLSHEEKPRAQSLCWHRLQQAKANGLTGMAITAAVIRPIARIDYTKYGAALAQELRCSL